MISTVTVRLRLDGEADHAFARDVRAYGVCRLAQDCDMSCASVSQFINGKGSMKQDRFNQMRAIVEAWKGANRKRYARRSVPHKVSDRTLR